MEYKLFAVLLLTVGAVVLFSCIRPAFVAYVSPLRRKRLSGSICASAPDTVGLWGLHGQVTFLLRTDPFNWPAKAKTTYAAGFWVLFGR